MAGRIIVNGAKPTYAFESITVGATAIGVTSTLLNRPSTTNGQSRVAEFALVTVETDSVRYRTDGTDPTAAVGHMLVAGDVLELDNYDDIRRFKAIRVTGNASLQVSLS